MEDGHISSSILSHIPGISWFKMFNPQSTASTDPWGCTQAATAPIPTKKKGPMADVKC